MIKCLLYFAFLFSMLLNLIVYADDTNMNKIVETWETPVYISDKQFITEVNLDNAYLPQSFIVSILKIETISVDQAKENNRINGQYLQLENEPTSFITGLNEIYKSDKHKVFESRLLDTYFIACALYFDFDSKNLLPDTNNHEIYSTAKKHFEKYKEHEFIQNLGNYVDRQSKAERGGVVYPLLMFAFSMQDYEMEIENIQTDVFKNADEFNEFLNNLQHFYIDTNANAFFETAESQKAMISFLKRELPKSNMNELILEMEDYTGNKADLYGNSEIRYRSVATLFRPFNASFYTFKTNDATYFIGQLSPTSSEKNPDKYDINHFVETSVHEFLHNYVNQPIYEMNDYILELAKDSNRADYTGNNPLYQMMDWHRIVDENIVRAIETSIYANIYSDRNKAYDEIMRKEVEIGGMKSLPKLYDSLKKYEQSRYMYANIKNYLQVMVDVMFEK